MKLAWEISHGFSLGAFDLSARVNPSPVGWQALPETASLAGGDLRGTGRQRLMARKPHRVDFA